MTNPPRSLRVALAETPTDLGEILVGGYFTVWGTLFDRSASLLYVWMDSVPSRAWRAAALLVGVAVLCAWKWGSVRQRLYIAVIACTLSGILTVGSLTVGWWMATAFYALFIFAPSFWVLLRLSKRFNTERRNAEPLG